MIKNYYHRSFIILKCEEMGYSILSGREPAGYCKLEIKKGKGRIQIYVQDLKPAEQHGVYEVYLVSEDGKVKPIKLANMHVDERGRGEKAVEFDVEDVNGSGYSLEMFHALAIVFKGKDLDGQVKIGYPLVGYSSRNVKIDWAGQVIYHLKGNSENCVADIDKKIQAEKKDQTKKSTKHQFEPFKEQSVLNNKETSEEYKELDGNEQQEAINKDKMQYKDKSGNEVFVKQQHIKRRNSDLKQQDQVENLGINEVQLDDELQKSYQEINQGLYESTLSNLGQKDCENRTVEGSSTTKGNKNNTVYKGSLDDDIKGNYWENVKDYFTSLFKTHRLIQPFDKDMGDAEWIRIQHQPPAAYPVYYAGINYNQAYSPYNQMYYTGYFEHYIIGLIREEEKVKYVVYGIPSMYSMIPPTNMIGFSRWVPVRDGYGMGYWLIYIDASTGCVVYPYKKE